jgi:iron-sulfur cluster assembly accessory protein
MIKITPEAEDHLKSIQDANGGKFPRLGVAGGGCAGFKYDWQLVEDQDIDKLSDEIIDLENGGTLVIDGTSLMFLFGTELQLKKDLFGTTLEIVNPQAQAGCGCGESINFDMEMVEANMNGGFQLPDD